MKSGKYHVLALPALHERSLLFKALGPSEQSTVETVWNIDDAMLAAYENPPDIVVVAQVAAASDDFALVRQWKNDARLREIPLAVVVSDHMDASATQQALTCGIDGFVVEPIPYAALDALIKTARSRSSPLLLRDVDSLARAANTPEAEHVWWRAVMDISNIGLWRRDLQSNHVYFSSVWVRQIGYAENELSGDHSEWYSRVHPDDLEGVEQGFEQLLVSPGTPIEREYRLRHKDGSYRWILARAAVIADEAGHPMRVVGTHVDITKSKQIEMALRESEAKFVVAFRSSPVPSAIFGPDDACVDVNEACCALLGYSREQLIGTRIYDLGISSAAVSAGTVSAHIRDELDRVGAIYNVEYRLRVRDGSFRDVISSSSRILLGGVPHRLAISTDITARKQMEQALRDSEAKFSAVFQASRVALVIATADGTYMEVNDAFKNLTGYRNEFVGRSARDLGLVSDEEFDRRLAATVSRAGAAEDFEVQIRTREGARRDVLCSMRLLHLNATSYVLASALDITDRKRAEDRIKQLNRTYAVLSDINQLIVRLLEPKLILDNACRIAVEKGGFLLAWIGIKDAEGTLPITACAGAQPDTLAIIEEILHGPGCVFTSQALDQRAEAVCNDIELDSRTASWRSAALQRGYRSMVSLPLMVEDRCVGNFNLYSSEVGFFDDAELQLLSELARDIAFALEMHERELDRRRAAEKLSQSEQRFRELAETIQEVFWIAEPGTGRLLYVSPAYETIFQQDIETAYRDPARPFEMVHPEDKQRVHEWAMREATGEIEYRVVRPDGTQLWIHAQLFPVYGTGGAVERHVGVARDVTESHLLEEQLAQSQKMQAIGTLAGGIAHDFNNLLAAILGNADLARMDLAASHPARVSVDEITRAGQRAKELVQRILTFSRPQEHQLRTTDLALVVDEAARLLRATIPAGVELVLAIDPVPTVQADASQIHQVIVNLVTNAWHAMEGRSGRIELRLKSHVLDAEFCQRHRQLQPGEYVCLSVTDTGKGMSAEVLNRIFEPFFTTKPPGQGAGLGLPMVHGIVRAHGGAVIVESKLEIGTSFSVFLPASYAGISVAPAQTPSPVSVRGEGQRILYIDDEEPLVYLMVRFLEKLGYRIEGHTEPVAGLAAFRADPSRFDLVITDRNMPGMSGVEVAQQVLQIRPDTPVVLVSGYLLPGEVEQARALGVREVVLKPNSVEGFGPLLQRIFSGQSDTTERGETLVD